MKIHEKYLITEKTFIIRDKSGSIVAGYDEDQQIVQMTDGDMKYVKKFKSKRDAEKWAKDHVDAGLGFTKGYKIEEL